MDSLDANIIHPCLGVLIATDKCGYGTRPPLENAATERAICRGDIKVEESFGCDSESNNGTG